MARRYPIPPCPEAGRLAEDEPSRRRPGGAGSSRRPGSRVERAVEGDARLEPGEVHAETDVRPMRERDLQVDVRTARRRTRSGSANTAGSRFAPASESVTRSPCADRGTRRAPYHASRSGRSPPRPARAAATPRHAPRTSLRSAATRARSDSRPSRWRNAFAIIASVVSIPPKRSTAAFEATCSRLSPPASLAAAATSDAAGSRSSAGSTDDRSRANASRPLPSRRRPGRDRRHLGDDRRVPAERLGRVRLLEPERLHHHLDRERPCERRTEVGSPRRARSRRAAGRPRAPRSP